MKGWENRGKEREREQEEVGSRMAGGREGWRKWRKRGRIDKTCPSKVCPGTSFLKLSPIPL